MTDREVAVPAVEETVAVSGTARGLYDGFVVAVGASAGGLDALERLFDGLSADSGAAYVVVQHLSPDHKSMMDNLLARHTAMPVTVAEHDMALAPNRVFLIPPGKHMTLAGDRLQLAPKPASGLSLPIDLFFTSAAEQMQESVIGVVLSGTGSDGTRGVLAINDAGGLNLAQLPETAKFDGMPRSAIATGLIDAVLSPEDLAKRILRHIGEGPRRQVPLAVAAEQTHHSSTLEAILQFMLGASGINFREYKPQMVLRRIERRMQVRHARTLEDYLLLLTGDPVENALLRRELLIPVTRFFRDGEAFDALLSQVIEPLVAERAARPDGVPIRVWVACCSTGEEAYSVAMLFHEAFAKRGSWPGLKLFATDVEQHYIDTAAAGNYAQTIAAEIDAGRLEMYFNHKNDQYQIRQEVRGSVVFARHNLKNDPPFTRMDLVCCRNALIYFQPPAQERVLRRLQYALAPGGVLFLGPSESLGVLHNDFEPISSKHKLFRVQRPASGLLSLDAVPRERRALVAAAAGGGRESALIDAGQAQLLRSYAPTTLLVGRERELIHVFGDAQSLLRFGEGHASLDVVRLLPDRLSTAAAALLHASERDGAPRRSEAMELDDGSRIAVVVRPVHNERGPVASYLLSFEPAGAPVATAAEQLTDIGSEGRAHLQALESELAATRDHLQATVEELETSNEELQATNEELMASNEELQSTNEELQSVNEELYTVNAEYHEKIELLHNANADLENLIQAASIPKVFLDGDLRITRFTPQAASLFKFRATDLGRPLEDFAHQLDYPELFADARRTLDSGAPVDREVRAHDGRWFLARVLPFPSERPRATQLILSFIDVTRVKDAQRLQAIIDSLPEQVAVLDRAGRIALVNTAWRRFSIDNGDTELKRTGPGANYVGVCEGARGDADAQRALIGLVAVLEGRSERFTLQYPCHSATERRWFLMHAAPLAAPEGGAVVSHIDITAWVEGGRAGPARAVEGKAAEGKTVEANIKSVRSTP
jgi:two-component system CheB/CheR fusion protein